MLGFSFSCNWDQGSYIDSTAKTTPRKLGALIRSKFLSPEVAFNLPYSLAQNTVVMSGLLLLAATWILQISYRNRYVKLLVLHSLPLQNPFPIVELQPCYVISTGIGRYSSEQAKLFPLPCSCGNRHLFIFGFFLNSFLICFRYFSSPSYNFMPCSGCSTLYKVNFNFKKSNLWCSFEISSNLDFKLNFF